MKEARQVIRRIRLRILRWRNHLRALDNYCHGYAWSCLKRDRKTKRLV